MNKFQASAVQRVEDELFSYFYFSDPNSDFALIRLL
jgi:hypothetical protein